MQFFGGTVTNTMVVSFGLMIVSSILGGYNDLTFNLPGYLWMLVNCVSSASYVLYMRKAIRKVQFRDFDTVYFNNYLTIPSLIIFSFLLDDWSESFHSFYYMDGDVQLLKGRLVFGIVVSGLAAFGISYATSWSVRVSSSTTYRFKSFYF